MYSRHNSSVLSLYWLLLIVVVCDVSQNNYAIYNFSVQVFFSSFFLPLLLVEIHCLEYNTKTVKFQLEITVFL